MNEKGEMKKEVEKKKCVSHLGGKLALMLQENDRNSSTPIQNTEVACVEIAGLCHDLGHGPFSHAFEDIIQPYEDGNKWKPDKQAVFMLKYLIKHNSLEKKLADLKIYAEDIDFICQLILGVKEDDEMLRENKFCLYQLVNNSVYGMDVDRWDYIARGAHYLHVGRKSTFDFKRILSSVKILDVKRGSKTRRELCFRDEVARDLNQMFLTSRQLNYASYQDRHSEVIAIIKKYKLLDSVKDPEAFCQVDDTIVNAIRQSLSQEPGMVKAREIIDRIHRREFYHCIAECKHAKEELSRFDCGGRNPLINIPFYKESSDGTFVAEFLPVDELQADLPPVDVSFRIYTKVPKLDRETVNMAKSRCETRLEMIHERQRSVPTKPVKQKVKSPSIGPVAPSPPLSAVGHVTSPSSGSFVSTDGDEDIPSLMSNPPDAVAAVGTGPAESNPRGSRSPEPEVKLH
ncbi:deoxynucleoside triphosphate triphosphohydrolase SAMHD1-like [Strongylocentrotus purpuratus]|uniref:HD domain-containing protein n=1 Tax=Strongylocentrotus purpuratus TaxID=7668 RepID=A0A7M7T304_STRPU|nr:deoxynucleoside triphosphate triphosphohydrolase SAMHD1-like [Strongylocentrotus purpuratus]